jgi:hypothetical protein
VSGALHITYRPRADTTQEGELSALASVYAYLLKRHDSKKANKPTLEPVGRNDGIEVKGDTADDDILPH